MKNFVGPLFFTAFLAVLITLSGVAHAQDSKTQHPIHRVR